MRCGCAECGAFMVNSDGRTMGCICPECGYRCIACLGTNSVISKEDFKKLTSLTDFGFDLEWDMKKEN